MDRARSTHLLMLQRVRSNLDEQDSAQGLLAVSRNNRPAGLLVRLTMKMITRFGFAIPAVLSVSCAAVDERRHDEGGQSATAAPVAEPYVIWQQSAKCIITKSLKPELTMCVTGSGDLDHARQVTAKSLMQWLDAVRDLHKGVATKVVFGCTNPDGRLTVDNSGEYAYAGDIHLKTSSADGTYLHEFGHAYACLGDTYVNGTAGACAAGQPHSVMCDGLLRDDLSADDIAGVRAQFIKMVGTDGSGGDKPDSGGDKPVSDPIDPNDPDGDGVPTKDDRCTKTPVGSHVWGPGEWYGCAGGESVNNPIGGDDAGGNDDADNDGVDDSSDRCANTPAGEWVWTTEYEGSWMGCAPGQSRTE